MRSWATFLEALGGVRPFAHILETIRTGRPGREIEFGIDLFEFLAAEPRRRNHLRRRHVRTNRGVRAQRRRAYDFSDVRTVVDLGGGNGTLLVEILRRHTHLSGVLFETPTVAARADAVLDATDIADRCKLLAGDFFERVPVGADCYVLANVLHDWDDARSVEILRNCRQAMSRRRPDPDHRAPDTRRRNRPGPHPAQRHQHARAHRRARANQRRIQPAAHHRRTAARQRPAGRIPLRRDRRSGRMNVRPGPTFQPTIPLRTTGLVARCGRPAITEQPEQPSSSSSMALLVASGGKTVAHIAGSRPAWTRARQSPVIATCAMREQRAPGHPWADASFHERPRHLTGRLWPTRASASSRRPARAALRR